MATPDFNYLYSLAKHGENDTFLSEKDNYRWLASWAQEMQDLLKKLWAESLVNIGPENEAGFRSIHLTMTASTSDLEELFRITLGE